MFKKSPEMHNSLDYHFKKLDYFHQLQNFTCSVFDTNQKRFYMFKTFKPQIWTIIIFSNVFFPY
jgi:hypothetical protein